MIAFLVSTVILVMLVLAFLLPPLWRRRSAGDDVAARQAANLVIFRSQMAELERERRASELGDENFQQACAELKRRLLEEVDSDQATRPARAESSRALALALLLIVPILAAVGYGLLGNTRALDPSATARESSVTPDQIVAMVNKLAQRLQEKPDDPKGWLMLAKSYRTMGRNDQAAEAYEKAGALVAESADLLTEYADLLAVLNGGSLQGKPMALINQALRLDPEHLVALWLAGTAAYDDKSFAAAVGFWERAMQTLPADSEDARTLASAIADAKNKGGISVDRSVDRKLESKGNPQTGAAADHQAAVRGQLELAPALQSGVSPNDTVFVFARAVGGSRMPIAIVKAKVADLPLDFVLDDSSAMTPENKISKQATVLVVARISKSGNAMPKPGDLESEAKTVQVGESGLRIVIERQL